MKFNIIKPDGKLSIKQSNLILLISCLIVVSLSAGVILFKDQQDSNSEQAATQSGLKKSAEEEIKKISYDSYQQWEELLKDYKMNEAGRLVEIPEVKVINLPKDINQINNIDKKKNLFLNILTIGAYNANQELLKQREKLIEIIKQYTKHGHLTREDNDWLQEKCKKYGVKEDITFKKQMEQLRKRLDIVPISLVLAQAASESGWGTSRFALAANNIFGEWTFDSQTPGLVPQERPANATYKIKKFSSIEAALNSYLLNLNKYYAYQKFREIRFELRAQGENLDSIKLAYGLLSYSEKREAYVEQLINIIRDNDLKAVDKLLRK
ncbi:MAG: glucosaminidase domain-containing protein [Bacillota bacterium]